MQVAKCGCPRDRLTGKVLDAVDQQLRIRREQRRGRFVTVISGFAPRSQRTDDLPAMFKHLKSKLATGGSHEGTTLEFQGDHRERLIEHFKSLGYPAKAAGG